MESGNNAKPLFDFLGGRRILLASASPRRRELMAALNIDVEQAPLYDTNESYPASMKAEAVPAYISKKKAHPYMASIADNEIVVTADTVVICNGNVLGKPTDKLEAAQMLRILSGKTHKVVTGVTLTTRRFQQTFSEVTEVEFARLENEEIDYYIENYLPLDKAGAYGIQEWIGYIGIRAIRGDYYNVMGLPLRALYEHLRQIGLRKR